MPNIQPKKLRELIAKAYWEGHTDGRLCGKNGTTNFGMAGLTIEAIAIKAGCRPIKNEDAAKHPAFKNRH